MSAALPAIAVLTTGGTIDKIYFDAKSEFQVGEPQVGEVLREANVCVPFTVRSLMRKDSLELTDADRAAIVAAVRAEPARHVIITHGTDTMLRTARALKAVADKVIVLTGAMQPARLRVSDAELNIGFALAAVQLLAPGVYVAMNGRVLDPERARKNVAENRFEDAAPGEIPG